MSTPKIGHPPLKMRRREQYDQVDKVGDFWWRFDDGKRVLHRRPAQSSPYF